MYTKGKLPINQYSISELRDLHLQYGYTITGYDQDTITLERDDLLPL